MFRALLWKEWRELWSLLPLAAALSIITVLIIQYNQRLLDPAIWQFAFFFWMLLGAVFVPTHLFVKERENGAAGFLFARPLDRFRLWWFKSCACLTILIMVFLVLFCTLTLLSYLYAVPDSYSFQKNETVLHSIGPMTFFISMSMLMSSFSRRQYTAFIGMLILILALWMLWTLGSLIYEPLGAARHFFSGHADRVSVLFVAVSPALLFTSLLIFARNDLPWRKKERVALAYVFIGIMACSLSAAAVVFLLGHLRGFMIPEEQELQIRRVSTDGNSVLLVLEDNKTRWRKSELISIDMEERQAYPLDRDYASLAQIGPLIDSVIYAREGNILFLKETLVLSDLHGNDQKILSERIPWSVFGMASMRSDYLAIVVSDINSSFGGKAYIALFHSSGALAGRYDLPALEAGAFLYPEGWDWKGRFYFSKVVNKRGGSLWSYWRVAPDDMKLERLSFLPQDGGSHLVFSPDGKWAALRKKLGFGRTWTPGREDDEALWLCNLITESSRLLSERIGAFSFGWSSTGSYLSWTEATDEEPDEPKGRNESSQLVLYEPETEKKTVFPLGGIAELEFTSWSITGQHMLLTADRKKGEFAVFSLADPGLKRIHLAGLKRSSPRWISKDRLLWVSGDTLMICDADGSNQREFAHLQNGEFSFR